MVSIDGTSYGTTPLGRARIGAGQHRVTVSLAGYQPASETVSLLCDNVYTRNYSLTIAPAGNPVSVAGNNQPVPAQAVPVQQVPVPAVNRSAVPPAITGNVAVIPGAPQAPGTAAGTCTRHYRGSGDLSPDPDRRLNCTTVIGSGDGIAVITIPAGTLVTDPAGRSVPAIRVMNLALRKFLKPLTAAGRPARPTASCRTISRSTPRPGSRLRSAKKPGNDRTRQP